MVTLIGMVYARRMLRFCNLFHDEHHIGDSSFIIETFNVVTAIDGMVLLSNLHSKH